MPSQVVSSVENNFTKGLITEATGLNFPENAATDTDNCDYTLIGDVVRRLGVNFEQNYATNTVSRTGSAIASYKWDNAGGDGNTQIVVEQVGGVLYFYNSSKATLTSPVSTQLLSSTVQVYTFVPIGGSFDFTKECQFTDGNGYLFVFHPNCDPIYCTYANGVITGNSIDVQIRDFTGATDENDDLTRPLTLSPEHAYNLTNQGWNLGNAWVFSSNTTAQAITGSLSFIVQIAGVPGITAGTAVDILSGIDSFPNGTYSKSGTVVMQGTVTSYTGTLLDINVTFVNPAWTGAFLSSWAIVPGNNGLVSTWNTDLGNYPSNSDVWWTYIDPAGNFNPTLMVNNISLSGPAAKGHWVLDAFNQQRSIASKVLSITPVTTMQRPKTGCWFQGRVWFTGVDDSFQATGDQPFTTWTETIYFSQIVQKTENFGQCYQTNDPTSQNLFDLLPTDGGTIVIQGSGSIYKLFPIQNGLLVFAANGVWFITGSQGIGFAADDYTITKISSVKSISSYSFVDVLGLPYFWNEDGIYTVTPSQSGSLTVQPITVGTIETFYDAIPYSSKQLARGAYDPINFVIRWIFKSEEAVSTVDAYTYDRMLNFNTYNKAFYPYTVDTTSASVNSIVYVTGPGGVAAALPAFKMFSSTLTTVSFSEEWDDDYLDWDSIVGVNYISYFVTGYKLHGQGQRRFQLSYLYVYSRNDTPTNYKIQGIWDYANTGNSGRWSTAQLVNNWSPNFSSIFRRHKIRGQGLVLQIKVSSVDGQPFDIMGWSAFESQNAGV